MLLRMHIVAGCTCAGGCNGCLNVDDAGLADLVADLDEVYLANSYDIVLSR